MLPSIQNLEDARKILGRLEANKLSHNLSKINYTLFHLPPK